MIKDILSKFNNWTGAIEVNGDHYDSVALALNSISDEDFELKSIILYSVNKDTSERKNLRFTYEVNTHYKIKVRDYMTWPATFDFDFMRKWNNDKPMPSKEMYGLLTVDAEGLVYMKLHSDSGDWNGWIIKSAILEMENLDED